jgi:guanylate kinase
VPHQPVEDGGRPLRASARRAGRAPSPLKLFVVTGPSGAGKGTLIRGLVGRRRDLKVAVSATTRPRREGEQDGREYYFLSDEEFDAKVLAGAFLEHVVFVGGRYGTLNAEVDRILESGRGCILELETDGAHRVKHLRPDAVTIFIAPPSFAELERRLRERATESAGEIGERLDLARRQMEEAAEFDYVVTNDDVDRAISELDAIITRESRGVGTLAQP